MAAHTCGHRALQADCCRPEASLGYEFLASLHHRGRVSQKANKNRVYILLCFFLLTQKCFPSPFKNEDHRDMQ